MARDEGVDFNLDDDIISELATYGVIKEGADGMCEILNPIYLFRIMRAFKPVVNRLKDEYFPEDTRDGLRDYLTPTGQIEMESLLDNFRDFIARAGFKILQVFDHRTSPEPRLATEVLDSLKIRSYVIPVVQEPPSGERLVFN